jgi:putative SOS response-associated peptidase YedK
MCGRFALAAIENLFTRFAVVEQEVEFRPHYNIAPTQHVPVIVTGGSNHLELMRWGLIPHWARDEKIGYKLINARSETVPTKPMFKYLLRKKRCLVPADGFYEWRKDDGKTPHYIRRKDEDLFAFAGLYDHWKNAEGEVIKTFIILTTEPNETVRAIHDRMPVMLRREHESAWVGMEELSGDKLKEMFLPYPDEEMEAYPISKLVNDPTYVGREIIEPARQSGQASMNDF